MSKLAREVFFQGERYALAWGKDSTERMRGKKYFMSLTKPDQMKLLGRMQQFADVGVLRDDAKLRRIQGASVPAFEFKIHKRRLVGCLHGGAFVVCDGFDKKTDRDSRSERELDAAVQRTADWLATAERST
jgi:phage-related protein